MPTRHKIVAEVDYDPSMLNATNDAVGSKRLRDRDLLNWPRSFLIPDAALAG